MFCLFIALPNVLNFFQTVGPNIVKVSTDISNFMSFVLSMSFGFEVLRQLQLDDLPRSNESGINHMVSSHDYGAPKETTRFWDTLMASQLTWLHPVEAHTCGTAGLRHAMADRPAPHSPGQGICLCGPNLFWASDQ